MPPPQAITTVLVGMQATSPLRRSSPASAATTPLVIRISVAKNSSRTFTSALSALLRKHLHQLHTREPDPARRPMAGGQNRIGHSQTFVPEPLHLGSDFRDHGRNQPPVVEELSRDDRVLEKGVLSIGDRPP